MYDEIIKGVMQNSSIRREPGDYVVEGLLFCGKCGTPKQCRITVQGREMTPYCLCACEAERLEKEEQAERERERLRLRSERRARAFGDSAQMSWTFDKDTAPNARASKIARRYADHFSEMAKDGQGLVFFGSVGTGKTFYASCILNAVIDQGYTGRLTNFAAIAEHKPKESDLATVGLLVLDDFEAERNTDYMAEIVHDVIDSRYRAHAPLIVTTNLTADELKNPADRSKQRIYSRILEMCIPVEVTGSDRRRDQLKDNWSRYKNLLGL